MQFKEWLKQEILLESTRPGVKMSLYPQGYGGIGQYPPCDWTPEGADAITYMPPDWLDFKFLYTWKPETKANWNAFTYVSLPYYLPPE